MKRLIAPMAGFVVAIHCKAGEAVLPGQELLVIEAMKMEHGVSSNCAGAVAQLWVEVGELVEEGAVLLEVSPAA